MAKASDLTEAARLIAGQVAASTARFAIADEVELRRPDGSVCWATVVCLNPVHANPTPFWAVVLPGWQPSDAPVGTGVWVADAEPGAAADAAPKAGPRC